MLTYINMSSCKLKRASQREGRDLSVSLANQMTGIGHGGNSGRTWLVKYSFIVFSPPHSRGEQGGGEVKRKAMEERRGGGEVRLLGWPGRYKLVTLALDDDHKLGFFLWSLQNNLLSNFHLIGLIMSVWCVRWKQHVYKCTLSAHRVRPRCGLDQRTTLQTCQNLFTLPKFSTQCAVKTNSRGQYVDTMHAVPVMPAFTAMTTSWTA